MHQMAVREAFPQSQGAAYPVKSEDRSHKVIGDAAIPALAQAIKPVSEGGSGAMAQIQHLYLEDLSFSDKTKHTMKIAMSKSGGQVHY